MKAIHDFIVSDSKYYAKKVVKDIVDRTNILEEYRESAGRRWNILTGADRDRIIETVRTCKAPSAHPPLYGDGKAAAHCLKALLES